MKIRFKSEEEIVKTKHLKRRDFFLKFINKEDIQNTESFVEAMKECVENKDLSGVLQISTLYVNSFFPDKNEDEV